MSRVTGDRAARCGRRGRPSRTHRAAPRRSPDHFVDGSPGVVDGVGADSGTYTIDPSFRR